MRKTKRANVPSGRAAGDWGSAGGGKSYVIVEALLLGSGHLLTK